ncbi:MAG TPA: CusA/CzcA family heavy metal efflux RND transporter [Thermoanaerobaculaceae bacterium]|nr:CusA/CzcA family heavy metal efflux RND transporter [Thermoanaerobaculaceae bacterium]
MKRFFSALLERPWVSWVAVALVVVGGVLAWRRLPIDAFPDVTNVQVMVLTQASGLSAEDVEQRVTTPIELQMGGLPQVTQVRSLSRVGLSQVVVVFEDDVDPYFSRQLVFERLQGAREGLPPGVEPELAPLSTGLGEIFQYTLEGDVSPMEKRTLQDWLVAPQLRSVAGVTEVNSFGGFVKQVQVQVHPSRLLAYGLTMRDVADALERGNSSAGGGYILKGWEQMVIRGDGLFHSLQDVERVVLKVADGTPVLIRDVADVAYGGETRQGAVTRDGQGETVAGMVIMLRGANSRTVVEAVKAQVARLGHMLPAGVRLDVFYDRTDLIRACIRTVVEALLWGALLVVVVLFLFVAELRTSLIVVLSLPLTFLATFVIMGWAGLSSNLMSLGGLAFSVGMVVDASIVVVENVRRHLSTRHTAPRRLVVVEALTEVARPVAFSVLVIALVIVPLLTLQGIEGKMFRPLALTLMFALLTSILVALLIVPALCDRILAQRQEREFGFVRAFHRGYLRLLGRAMAAPRATLGVAVAFLAVSLAVVPMLGTEFIPSLDEGAIAINVVRLPNASLEGSVEVARLIEDRARRFEEVATVVSKTGRAEISEDPMGPEQTDVFIMLKPRGQWRSGRSKAELIEALNRELSAIPGLRLAFSQPIALRVNELISGVKSDLAVKIFGPDLALLKRLADQAAELIRPVTGSTDLKVEQVAGLEGIDVTPDRGSMSRWGLNASDVSDLLELGVAGRKVTTLVEGQRRVAVVARLAEEARSDMRALGGLLVSTPGGQRVPLGQVAAISESEGPSQISREKGMRRVVVEVNVRGRDLGGFVAEVQERLAVLERSLPEGTWIEYGGQFENQQRAMRQLAVVVPIVLALILVLLVSVLGSLRNALVVVLNLPFALVGGVLAAAAFGMHLSVSAAVAFIVLLGIAVQNGVVLVAFFRQLRDRGRDVSAAVTEGCDLRFRPLFMTALTSFIGHLPMLFAMGSGADIQKPLAVVVMGGIVTSTLLTLLVLPVLWARVEARATRGEETVEAA